MLKWLDNVITKMGPALAPEYSGDAFKAEQNQKMLDSLEDELELEPTNKLVSPLQLEHATLTRELKELKAEKAAKEAQIKQLQREIVELNMRIRNREYSVDTISHSKIVTALA